MKPKSQSLLNVPSHTQHFQTIQLQKNTSTFEQFDCQPPVSAYEQKNQLSDYQSNSPTYTSSLNDKQPFFLTATSDDLTSTKLHYLIDPQIQNPIDDSEHYISYLDNDELFDYGGQLFADYDYPFDNNNFILDTDFQELRCVYHNLLRSVQDFSSYDERSFDMVNFQYHVFTQKLEQFETKHKIAFNTMLFGQDLNDFNKLIPYFQEFQLLNYQEQRQFDFVNYCVNEPKPKEIFDYPEKVEIEKPKSVSSKGSLIEFFAKKAVQYEHLNGLWTPYAYQKELIPKTIHFQGLQHCSPLTMLARSLALSNPIQVKTIFYHLDMEHIYYIDPKRDKFIQYQMKKNKDVFKISSFCKRIASDQFTIIIDCTMMNLFIAIYKQQYVFGFYTNCPPRHKPIRYSIKIVPFKVKGEPPILNLLADQQIKLFTQLINVTSEVYDGLLAQKPIFLNVRKLLVYNRQLKYDKQVNLLFQNK